MHISINFNNCHLSPVVPPWTQSGLISSQGGFEVPGAQCFFCIMHMGHKPLMQILAMLLNLEIQPDTWSLHPLCLELGTE